MFPSVSPARLRRFLRQLPRRRVRPVPWREADAAVAGLFRGARPEAEDFATLFRYFLTGFLAYRSPAGGRADYPGEPSYSAATDSVEGFARCAPLLAAWLAGGRPGTVPDWRGDPVDLAGVLRRGFLAGSDPASADYWGDPREFRQLSVEAADLALALWLSRAQVWARLAPADRQRIAGWLAQAAARPVVASNWNLFPATVHAVLLALEAGGGDAAELRRHLDLVKAWHLGDGWFSDGPGGRIDHYNAWGFHYHLFWLDQLQPGLDRAWIRACAAGFNRTFPFFFSPAGFPYSGRSVPYRGALPAPLVAGAITGTAAPGQARRALTATLAHFLGHGALRDGTWSHGYWAQDYRLVDRYSGPASSLWSLRALVLAFSQPIDHPFWQDPALPLPVETGSYDFSIPAIGWRLTGDRDSAEVRVHPQGNQGNPWRPAEPYGVWRRLATRLTGWPFRPRNNPVKYALPVYSSKAPFGPVEK